MFPARMALAKVVDAVQGKKKDDENLLQCNVYTAKLKLFQKAEAQNPSTLALQEITNQTFEILNTNSSPLLVGQEVTVAQGPDERWFTLEKPHPRIQFVTTGKIVDRAVTVKVLRAHNTPPNLDTPGEILEYGDTLTIYDPFNLWSDIEPKATGWAYLAYEQQDDITTSEINEAHTVRYEIEECSLPVNEIKAKLRDCLPGGMSQGTAIVEIENQAIRSSYPNVDHPPNAEIPEPAEGAETGEVEVLFENPHHLDGVADSPCILRRITNLKTSDPENYQAPKASSSTTVYWELVKVSKKIARHAHVTFTPGFGWVGTQFYDGFDPNATPNEALNCEITFNCPLCECPTRRSDVGDEGYAFLDTTAQTIQYYVYSTKSAFYGKPSDVRVIGEASAGGQNCSGTDQPLLEWEAAQCGIKHPTLVAKVFCEPDCEAEPVMPIPTTETTVATCDGANAAVRDVCVGQCEWTYYDTPEPTWTRVIACSDPGAVGCDCVQPDVTNPVSGGTYYSDCTGAQELCITLGTTTVKQICNTGSGGGGSCEICIPLDPPGGGGGECPDPCATTTTGGTGTGGTGTGEIP